MSMSRKKPKHIKKDIIYDLFYSRLNIMMRKHAHNIAMRYEINEAKFFSDLIDITHDVICFVTDFCLQDYSLQDTEKGEDDE